MTHPTESPARPVIAGVDGSESSVQAAVYAAEEAQRRELPLHIVHLTPWRAGGEPMPMASPEVRSRFQESATQLVESAADAVREATGLEAVTASVVDEYPVDGLIALSAEAAVLVLGKRGVGGMPGLLLGSTAGAVVQHANCPVIVLPGKDDSDEKGEEDETSVDQRHSVVAGVELRHGDEQVLTFAAAAAATRGTGLTALHAWRNPTVEAAIGQFGPYADWSAVEGEKRGLLADAVDPLREAHPDIQLRETVVHDRPATALLAAGATAQLLVVGHRHRGRLARLGSTTNAVLHRSSCPVAVVPLVR